MKRPGILYALLLNFIVLLPLHAANNKTTPVDSTSQLPEIHMLVDVSGSMKQTDPQNLRVKAIKMFIYLIKQKALMQIQTFATNTQLMMPLKPVSTEFQNLYVKKSYQIDSNGEWTDIEGALNTANKSWGLGKKIIILLTDGAVDLGEEFRTNQSKDKLTESVLHNLQKKGVRVFTVGFSKEADKNLLDNLASKTNGLSQVVISSNDIDSVLYSIFTAIIPVNGAPIDTNKDSTRSINIDKNIRDLTLILKKTEDISKLFLIDPKGRKKSIQAINNKDISTNNYLFVNIDKPLTGKWILVGPKQEVERAIILTNVNLVSNVISGIYFQGESISVNCFFTLLGKRMTTPVVIENTKMSAVLQNKSTNYSYTLPYKDDGVFKTNLHIDKPVGFYQLVLNAKNKFFSRQLQFIIDIKESPIAINVSNNWFEIKLIRTDLIKEDSVTVHLEVEQSALTLTGQKNNSSWGLDLFSLCSNPSLMKQALIIFQGKTIGGRTMSLKLEVPEEACHHEQYITHIPTVQLMQPSLIQKIPVFNKIVEPIKQEPSLKFNIMIYSLIVILLIIIFLFILVLFLEMKYEKKIHIIRKQLKSET